MVLCWIDLLRISFFKGSIKVVSSTVLDPDSVTCRDRFGFSCLFLLYKIVACFIFFVKEMVRSYRINGLTKQQMHQIGTWSRNDQSPVRFSSDLIIELR